MTADPDVAAEFARAFGAFLEWIHDAPPARSNPVVALVADHLGRPAGPAAGDAGAGPATPYPVIEREVPPWDHVNLQVALDAWSTVAGREVVVYGLSVPLHHELPTLADIVLAVDHLQLRSGPPVLVDRPSGPGRTLACLQAALLLVRDERGSYVLAVRGPERHRPPSLTLEVAGLPVADAQQVLGELAELRSTLSVYRGQVPGTQCGRVRPAGPAVRRTCAHRPRGGGAARGRPGPDRAQHPRCRRAPRPAPGGGAAPQARAAALRAARNGEDAHHAVHRRALSGYTTLMLAGRSLTQIGSVAGLARGLTPAAVVLEDVDLVAEDRGFGSGPSPVLFELLDAMDGAAADADLVFLLTTNRADLLEPALAARPGRVDVAVEIGLPDAAARRRLFDLYTRGVPLEPDPDLVEVVVERTAGSTASLLRELVRRAVLEALRREPVLGTVTRADVTRALEDLLDSTRRVTRTLLGVGAGAGGDVATDRTAGGHGALVGPGVDRRGPSGWRTPGGPD